MAQHQLSPYPTQMGLFTNLMAQQAESLVLKGRFTLIRDSFSVKTVDGRAMFKVKGEYISLTGRKHVMDMQGNVLFDIRKECFSILPCYYAEDASGKRILDVQSRLSRRLSRLPREMKHANSP